MLTPTTFESNAVYWKHQTTNSDSAMRKEKEPERRGDVLKLCIINHVQHELYIDAIPMAVLDNDYEGDEETFLKKNYGFTDEELKEGYVSWEWFNNMQAYGLATDAITTSYINEI